VTGTPALTAEERAEIAASKLADVVCKSEGFDRRDPGFTIEGAAIAFISSAIREAEEAVHALYRDDAPITDADVAAALAAFKSQKETP